MNVKKMNHLSLECHWCEGDAGVRVVGMGNDPLLLLHLVELLEVVKQ